MRSVVQNTRLYYVKYLRQCRAASVGAAIRRPRKDGSRIYHASHYGIPRILAGIPGYPPRSKGCQDAVGGGDDDVARSDTCGCKMMLGGLPGPVGHEGLILCDYGDARTHDAAACGGGGGNGGNGPAACWCVVSLSCLVTCLPVEPILYKMCVQVCVCVRARRRIRRGGVAS